MDNIEKRFINDDYYKKNPLLFVEGSEWKISKIIPLVDLLLTEYVIKDEINLLDVGGGAGLILKFISNYIQEKHEIKVNKYAIELSPKILEIQKKNNPDLKRFLNENIKKTSLNDKEIDLTLLIDVLELVDNPQEAFAEINRISKYVIFKVILHDNLSFNLWNLVTKNRIKKSLSAKGHINFYNLNELKRFITKENGEIIDYYYTNMFEHYLDSDLSKFYKLCYSMARYFVRIAPRISSLIFSDSVMILVDFKNK